MKKTLGSLFVMGLVAAAGIASAADYNKPPADDKLYPACVKEVNESYTGGNEKSPVKGQSKAQAYCLCLWNETPDDFKGSLVKFADTSKGKSIKSACEKHSDWKS